MGMTKESLLGCRVLEMDLPDLEEVYVEASLAARAARKEMKEVAEFAGRMEGTAAEALRRVDHLRRWGEGGTDIPTSPTVDA